MKARTKYRNGENAYEVYFCYEDYYGGNLFRNYDDMMREGDVPNEEGTGYLVGWLHSFYWGSYERIDMLELKGRPTVAQVRKFIIDCKNIIKEEE